MFLPSLVPTVTPPKLISEPLTSAKPRSVRPLCGVLDLRPGTADVDDVEADGLVVADPTASSIRRAACSGERPAHWRAKSGAGASLKWWPLNCSVDAPDEPAVRSRHDRTAQLKHRIRAMRRLTSG